MADQTIIPVEPGHPTWQLPIIFADGIANMAPISGNLRFYLYRTDPETTGKLPYKNQIFAQMVIPAQGFVQAAAFFERAMKLFISQGTLSKELVNAARTAEGLEPWPDQT